MLRRLYEWVLRWGETPYGTWALFFLAVAESSFFPIPPDVLLIALAISSPKRSLFFALVCSLGSVIGGAIGYGIGLSSMELIGYKIIDFYGLMEKYNLIGDLYNRYSAWAVGIAGFTPIPYKVFTIAAGAFHINFIVFVTASIISRSARFFLVSLLIYRFGPQIKVFIDRYFNPLAIILVVGIVGGFILMRHVF
ncbi:MAG: DedA family protein [Deltaproteobacteria bacterium]|nr:DedA family protein [Deltaproteobacteria bacterium]